MKKIQREETVVVRKEVYVSVDGKEFENEKDCAAWEKSYKGTLEASWKRIKKEEVSDCNLGLSYSSDDHECYAIKPKNLDEIVLINAYVESSTYGNGAKLTTDHIGKVIVLNFGYDHDYCDVVILEDHLNDLKKYIGELEDKFNEEKEETINDGAENA